MLAGARNQRRVREPARQPGLRFGVRRRDQRGLGRTRRRATCSRSSTARSRAATTTRRGLGIAGGSYGGFMTTWLLGHSKRFAAGVSMRAVNDFVSESGRIGCRLVSRVGTRGAVDRRRRDANCSKVRRCGLRERSRRRCWWSTPSATTAARSTRASSCSRCCGGLGKTVEFVRFTGDGHNLSRSRQAAQPRLTPARDRAWFIRHLRPDGVASASNEAGSLFFPLPGGSWSSTRTDRPCAAARGSRARRRARREAGRTRRRRSRRAAGSGRRSSRSRTRRPAPRRRASRPAFAPRCRSPRRSASSAGARPTAKPSTGPVTNPIPTPVRPRPVPNENPGRVPPQRQQTATAHHRHPGGDARAHADARDDLPRERRGQHENDRHRQQRERGLERRLVRKRLQRERGEVDQPVHPKVIVIVTKVAAENGRSAKSRRSTSGSGARRRASRTP